MTCRTVGHRTDPPYVIPGCFQQDPDVRSCVARSLLAIYRSSVSETPPKSAALGIERPGRLLLGGNSRNHQKNQSSLAMKMMVNNSS